MTSAGADVAGTVKHSLVISGHRTSVSLESAFWVELRMIAARRTMSIAALVGEIDSRRRGANLSSAIRVFILEQALSRIASLSGIGVLSDDP